MDVLAWGNRDVSGADADGRDTLRQAGGGRPAAGQRSSERARAGAGAGGTAARLPGRPAGLDARTARRRGIGPRLERALIASAAAHDVPLTIVAATFQPWASATFVGARHALNLVADASDALDAWLGALAELELPIAGHLVADIELGSATREGALVRVAVAVLTVEEC